MVSIPLKANEDIHPHFRSPSPLPPPYFALRDLWVSQAPQQTANDFAAYINLCIKRHGHSSNMIAGKYRL